jgi:hypothetical protein
MEKREDTKLEAEGAEFLVLGNLLLNKITAFKAYHNFPGFDLIATNPHSKKSIRIQVKSRFQTDYDNSIIIKNFDCDFVIHVALNRGYRYSKKKNSDPGIKDPEYYIFPVKIIKEIESNGDKKNLNKILDKIKYKDNWSLIQKALKME